MALAYILYHNSDPVFSVSVIMAKQLRWPKLGKGFGSAGTTSHFGGSGGCGGKAPHDGGCYKAHKAGLFSGHYKILSGKGPRSFSPGQAGNHPSTGCKEHWGSYNVKKTSNSFPSLVGSKSRTQRGCELCWWGKENTDLFCATSTKRLACQWENLTDLSPQAEPKYSHTPSTSGDTTKNICPYRITASQDEVWEHFCDPGVTTEWN